LGLKLKSLEEEWEGSGYEMSKKDLLAKGLPEITID
jgi:hypothetical protein